MDKFPNGKKLSSGISQTRLDLHCFRTNVARFPHKHLLCIRIFLLAAYLTLLLVNEEYGLRASNVCQCMYIVWVVHYFLPDYYFFKQCLQWKEFLKFNKDIQAVMIDMSYSSCVMVWYLMLKIGYSRRVLWLAKSSLLHLKCCQWVSRFLCEYWSCYFCWFQGNFLAGGAHFGMHTPPDSLPSSPIGPFSPFGAFPFSPISPVDSESSISPIRPSYRTASMFPRCQPRQIGLPPTSIPPTEMSYGSLFTDPRWTGVNPMFGLWNDNMGFEYMQQQGLTHMLSG